MELREMIERAAEKTGGQKELADKIGINPNNLTNAKRGERGLPTYACVKLAQLIGEDERHVIAASELVTEKNPERRAVWLPFVQEIATGARKQNVGKDKSLTREPSFT